jgi:hypothetical protein
LGLFICPFLEISSFFSLESKFWGHLYIQGNFEGCADILTCDRTPQKVTIERIVSYANVDILREKKEEKYLGIFETLK